MSDEDEEYLRNLDRWAQEPLPVFRLVDWPGSWSLGGGSRAVRMSQDNTVGREVVMSRSVTHQNQTDPSQSITVMSHRPHDRASVRDWAPKNMLIAVVRAEIGPNATPERHNRRVRRLHADAATGKILWTPATIVIDATPVDVEVMTVGDAWAAVAFLDDVYVTIDSRGVPFAGIALARIGDAPGPDWPAPPRWGPRPARSQRFPSSQPVGPVPDHARVEMTYADDRLSGTVRGEAVDLTMTVPHSRSTATGSFAGATLSAAWTIEPNAVTHPDVPARLHGTFSEIWIVLEATFHLDPGYLFEHGTVTGQIGSELVHADVEAADGGFNSSRTVAAQGTFAGVDFNLFGTVSADLTKAMIRGHVGAGEVELDATRRRGTSRLSGRYEGPSAFLALLVGALLFFL